MRTSICTACFARPVHARGYCTICYARAWRAGQLPPIEKPRACAVAGCDRPLCALGLCKAHYMRDLRHGDPLICKRDGRPRQAWVCSVGECGRLHYARGFCRSHYSKWLARRHRSPAADRPA